MEWERLFKARWWNGVDPLIGLERSESSSRTQAIWICCGATIARKATGKTDFRVGGAHVKDGVQWAGSDVSSGFPACTGFCARLIGCNHECNQVSQLGPIKR
jgi:hypothetical protein